MINTVSSLLKFPSLSEFYLEGYMFLIMNVGRERKIKKKKKGEGDVFTFF